MATKDAVFWSTVVQAAAAVVGLVVAVVATFISLASMNATKKYAEAAITPYLIVTSNYDAEVQMKNVGEGPALIKRYVIRTSAQVYDLTEDNWSTGEAKRAVEGVGKETSSAMSKFGDFSQSVDDVRMPSAGDDLNVKFVLEPPGFLLSKGEAISIFGISGKHEAALNAIKEFMARNSSKIYENFDMEICYCSLSDASCYVKAYSKTPRIVKSCKAKGAFDLLSTKPRP